MKFQVNTPVSFEAVTLCELKGKERACEECHIPFEEGERVIVFAVSNYKGGNVEIGEDVTLVHVARRQGRGSCLEDFIARRLQTLEPASAAPPTPVAEPEVPPPPTP